MAALSGLTSLFTGGAGDTNPPSAPQPPPPQQPQPNTETSAGQESSEPQRSLTDFFANLDAEEYLLSRESAANGPENSQCPSQEPNETSNDPVARQSDPSESAHQSTQTSGLHQDALQESTVPYSTAIPQDYRDVMRRRERQQRQEERDREERRESH